MELNLAVALRMIEERGWGFLTPKAVVPIDSSQCGSINFCLNGATLYLYISHLANCRHPVQRGECSKLLLSQCMLVHHDQAYTCSLM